MVVILHAPSSVESPPIAGAGMAILQIFDFGLKGNADQVQFSRAVAAHAYLDEVEGGPAAPVDAGVIQSSLEEQWLEVAWQGPGEVTLRFIDRDGQALLEENISAFGSPAIQCRTRRPLTLDTRDGKVDVVPVVLSRSAAIQAVTFNAQPREAYVRRRCESMGCSNAVMDEAYRGVCGPLSRPTILPTIDALGRRGILPR